MIVVLSLLRIQYSKFLAPLPQAVSNISVVRLNEDNDNSNRKSRDTTRFAGADVAFAGVIVVPGDFSGTGGGDDGGGGDDFD